MLNGHIARVDEMRKAYIDLYQITKLTVREKAS